MMHAMVQLGAVDLEGNEFYAAMRPFEWSVIDPNALKAIGLTEEQIMDYPDPREGIVLFNEWLGDLYGGKRIPVWSDNPGFDWSYVNGYLWYFTGGNPLGWSMRRIGDFYAGRVHDVSATSKWKRMRETKHTHNALDDARGNAEALRKILEGSKFGRCDACSAQPFEKCRRQERVEAAGNKMDPSACLRHHKFGDFNPW